MSCDSAPTSKEGGELQASFGPPQQTTHQLPSDIEGDNDEGEDQACAAGEDERRRLLNKRKLRWEVERCIVRRGGNRHIHDDGHGL